VHVQDGADAETTAVATEFNAQFGVHHVALPRDHFKYLSAERGGVKFHLRHRQSNSTLNNARLAHNYFNLFGHIFAPKLTHAIYQHAVILEDDLLPAPDFLEFFEVGVSASAVRSRDRGVHERVCYIVALTRRHPLYGTMFGRRRGRG